MRIVHFKKQNISRIGIKTEEGILDVKSSSKELGFPAAGSIKELFSNLPTALNQLNDLLEAVQKESMTDFYINEESIYFLPINTDPDKIITIDYNYLMHASEQNGDIPTALSYGGKFKNSLAAHNQTIPLPTFAEKYDYGAELVIVIGKKAKNISKESAFDYILGYTVGNDLSSRDIQEAAQNKLAGKTLDYFAPVGPYLVTKDEVDPDHLDIQLSLNGNIRQRNNTKNMLFCTADIVSMLSQYMTLSPGDLIFTGTPEGVTSGFGMMSSFKEHVPGSNWISSGDTIEVSIESIGTLRNTFF